MSGICGWIGECDLADSALEQMARRLPCVDDADVRVARTKQGAIAVAGQRPPTGLFQIDGAVVAFCGHPYWRISGEAPIRGEPLAMRLLALYRERGHRALEVLAGDFSLAILDEARRGAVLAVDRSGIRRLVRRRVGKRLFFASDTEALRIASLPDAALDPQSILNYVYFHVVPGPRTVLAGIERIPAGRCVEVSAAGSDTERTYWQMRFDPEPDAALDSLKPRFLEALSGATRVASDTAACGCFLSGGTDSSTISGMLGRVGGTPARTFSIGFDAAGYDEMSYARIAARHFGTRHHEYYVTPADVVDAVPRIAAAYDEPFGNASAVPTFYCARLAQSVGVERLLAGDGGDELFGGNARYAKQYLLGLYERLPRMLRAGLIEPLLVVPAVTKRLPLVRKARSYVEQARVPMPQRYESYNLVERLGWATVFTPEFLAEADAEAPHRLMREAHEPYASDALIDQMLAIDLRFVLADSDLPKVTRMCELAGVDVAFPMLDEAVIEFAARLPARMKLRGTQLRWFFKEALRDFLPAEVITKEKHGFGLPVGVWLTSHRPLLDLARSSVERLGGRGIFRQRFLDDLFDCLLPAHPAYYGTMVWVLMMLGLWMDRESSNAGRPLR